MGLGGVLEISIVVQPFRSVGPGGSVGRYLGEISRLPRWVSGEGLRGVRESPGEVFSKSWSLLKWISRDRAP